MGYASRPCTLNEPFCTAKPTAKHRGITVACRVCGRQTCMSCAVLAAKGITCHPCAEASDAIGARQVKAHRASLWRGGTMEAPRSRLDAVSSAFASPVPPSVARRKAKRAVEPAGPPGQPAPVETAAQASRAAAWPPPAAPAVPAEYPVERRKDLGYAR